MSMKCLLKTIIAIHLHVPILQLQTFMFKVDQADMYPWQIFQNWLILQPTIGLI